MQIRHIAGRRALRCVRAPQRRARSRDVRILLAVRGPQRPPATPTHAHTCEMAAYVRMRRAASYARSPSRPTAGVSKSRPDRVPPEVSTARRNTAHRRPRRGREYSCGYAAPCALASAWIVADNPTLQRARSSQQVPSLSARSAASRLSSLVQPACKVRVLVCSHSCRDLDQGAVQDNRGCRLSESPCANGSTLARPTRQLRAICCSPYC